MLAGRRRDALETLAALARGATQIEAADLGDPPAAEALIAAGEPLDILVNNAGVTRDMLALRLKDADWRHVLETNLTAAFRSRARR